MSFYTQSGGQCFSKYFGESEKNLIHIFNQARNNTPSIIFFDEIDTLCPIRGSSDNQVDNTNSIVNTFLSEMNNLPDRMLIIGATNRISAVDPAVLRSGRFGLKVKFDLPNEQCRKEILRVLLTKRNVACSESILRTVASDAMTNTYSGADLDSLVKKAAFCAFDRLFPNASHWSLKEYAELKPKGKYPEPLKLEDWRKAVKAMNRM